MTGESQIFDESLKENKIVFPEPFFLSDDKKTIMGETLFQQILFLDYRDTEAGSNPREYNGLQKANLHILASLLKDYKNMFRFLHSGIIISVVNAIISEDRRVIEYDHCCLTNGNQTRFIILILVVLKLLFKNKQPKSVSRNKLGSFLAKVFSGYPNAENVVPFLRESKIRQMINHLLNNRKHLKAFQKIDLKDFVGTRIRIHINIIDEIRNDLEDELDEYSAGSLIAQANNDTQAVKADDIFATTHKKELVAKVFTHFISKCGSEVKIEYRLGEIAERVNKVHILALLRPVVATGLITKEKEIFRLTNQRNPIYNLFEKLIKKDKSEETINVVSRLIPLLYRIRTDHVKPVLDQHKRELIRKYKEKAIQGDLEDSVIAKEVNELSEDDSKLEKLIKRSLSYNVEHILPVLIFRIRNLIVEKENSDELDLNVNADKLDDLLGGLTEVIYERYVAEKLKGVRLSLTTMVRSYDFYTVGTEAYTAFKRTCHLEESDFISKHRFIVE